MRKAHCRCSAGTANLSTKRCRMRANVCMLLCMLAIIMSFYIFLVVRLSVETETSACPSIHDLSVCKNELNVSRTLFEGKLRSMRRDLTEFERASRGLQADLVSLRHQVIRAFFLVIFLIFFARNYSFLLSHFVSDRHFFSLLVKMRHTVLCPSV